MTDQISRKRSTPPSWTADLRRAIWCGVGLAVGETLLLLLARTGLMRNETTNNPIVADAGWAGILVGIGGVAWAVLQVSTTRDDTGFRHDRLTTLLALGVLISTAIQLVTMSVWPLVVGDHAAPDTIIGTLTSNPQSLAITAGFVVTIQSFGAAVVLALVRIRMPGVLVAVLGLLILLGIGGWQGITVLGSAATPILVAIWVALALAGVLTMMVMATWQGPKRHHTWPPHQP